MVVHHLCSILGEKNTLFYRILPSFPVPDIDRSIDESNLIFLQTEIEREMGERGRDG